MRISNLYIRDFGIFSNQSLVDLGAGLVIIGGYNRAGKTTLMQILRYLGYGFPQGRFLPDAVNKYHIEGEMILEDAQKCQLRVSGHGQPAFYSRAKEEVINPYQQMDSLTYQQIFTISLDELQRIPKNISNREMDKLQSVLLGAGLGDLVQLPLLEDTFLKEAEKIAGKTGSPRVKELKPYNQMIQEGLNLRKSALNQVQEYRQREEELAQMNRKIEVTAAEIEATYAEITRLDVLKHSYFACSEKRELEILLASEKTGTVFKEFSLPREVFERAKSLRPRLEEAKEQYNHSIGLFRKTVKSEEWSELKERLISRADVIKQLITGVSGLKEKLQNYRLREEDYYHRQGEILTEMDQLNQGWRGNMSQVLLLETDVLHQDRLANQVILYREYSQKMGILHDKLEDLQRDESGLEASLAKVRASDPVERLKRYYILAGIWVFAGLSLSFVNLWIGTLTGILGIIGTGLVVFLKVTAESNLRAESRSLRQQLILIRTQIGEREEEIKHLHNKLREVEEELAKYRQALGLGDQFSPEMLKDYYRRVQELKREIIHLQRLEEKLSLDYEELVKGLEQISDLFKAIYNLKPTFGEGDVLRRSEELFARLAKAREELELALALEQDEAVLTQLVAEVRIVIGDVGDVEDEDVVCQLDRFIANGERFFKEQELYAKIEILRSRILQSLKTDRVQKAIECKWVDVKDDQTLLTYFENYYTEFTSLQDVNRAYADATAKVEFLEKRVNTLKEERQSVRDELKRLATTENLEIAQRQIDQARASMRPLAEHYAVYNVAAFLLKQIRQGFIERTKDTLLQQTSEIFRRITGGEYDQILPPEDLKLADFQTVTAEGKINDSSETLSRGTREQLFLAVRINRIKEIKPTLPVILDDTLVNFDRQHMARGLDMVLELAQSHQVFLLTCHPQLVNYVAERSNIAQYWQLAEGHFYKTESRELINYLS